MVYDLADGDADSVSTKIYLLSDGRIQIHGGSPIDTADRLLEPSRARTLLKRLRDLATGPYDLGHDRDS